MRKTTLITLTLAGLLLAGSAAHASSPSVRKMIALARAAQETSSGWALVSAGERAAARAAQEAPAEHTIPPRSPAELVHDVKAVLHHAGFRPERAERGIPGRAPFIHNIEWIEYTRPALCGPAMGGFDPLRDYLAVRLGQWGAAHTGDRWAWRDPAADVSVALWYARGRCHPRRHGGSLRPAEVRLTVVHYTLPAR